MLERLIQEVRRREKIIRIFPSKDSVWRLVGALLAGKHEDGNLGLPRSTSRRYLKTDEFYEWIDRQSEPEAKPSTLNQPIVLYSLPNWRRSLHNKFDLTSGGGYGF